MSGSVFEPYFNDASKRGVKIQSSLENIGERSLEIEGLNGVAFSRFAIRASDPRSCSSIGRAPAL